MCQHDTDADHYCDMCSSYGCCGCCDEDEDEDEDDDCPECGARVGVLEYECANCGAEFDEPDDEDFDEDDDE